MEFKAISVEHGQKQRSKETQKHSQTQTWQLTQLPFSVTIYKLWGDCTQETENKIWSKVRYLLHRITSDKVRLLVIYRMQVGWSACDLNAPHGRRFLPHGRVLYSSLWLLSSPYPFRVLPGTWWLTHNFSTLWLKYPYTDWTPLICFCLLVKC